VPAARFHERLNPRPNVVRIVLTSARAAPSDQAAASQPPRAPGRRDTDRRTPLSPAGWRRSSSGVSFCGRLLPRSIPTSLIASTTTGWTAGAGSVPADRPEQFRDPRIR
jgi:hypothetical protein